MDRLDDGIDMRRMSVGAARLASKRMAEAANTYKDTTHGLSQAVNLIAWDDSRRAQDFREAWNRLQTLGRNFWPELDYWGKALMRAANDYEAAGNGR